MAVKIVDQNFNLRKQIDVAGTKVYDLPSAEFSLFGVNVDEKTGAFVRMDLDVAKAVSAGVYHHARHTSGGRLCFATDSTSLKIAVEYAEFGAMPHMPLTGSSGFSLFELTDKGERYVAMFAPYHIETSGFTASVQLGGGFRRYVLYFPLYNVVNRLSVALDESAQVQPINPYREIKPILYYGSSITQGGCASRPDQSYEALICKRNHIDFINLGFSGNAKGEQEMVAYLAGINCSLFVCDYDHNAPTLEHLQATHYPLYEQFRKAQPTTPIIFVSRPGVRRGDAVGLARERVIRNTYLRAKRQGDRNVYFLSGTRFFKENVRWNFTVDTVHPTDYGFALMAKEMYKKMLEIDEQFGEKDD